MILGMKTYSPLLSYLINCTCEYILNELNASGWWYSRVVFYLAGILASVRVCGPMSGHMVTTLTLGSGDTGQGQHRRLVTGWLELTCAQERRGPSPDTAGYGGSRGAKMGDAGTLLMASFIKFPSWNYMGKLLQEYSWSWCKRKRIDTDWEQFSVFKKVIIKFGSNFLCCLG